MYIRDIMKDEIRSGFLVTTDRKKIWEKELEILDQFALICARHGWHWWVDYGTMLGAARHQGFIPWDDDVDVCMLRPEYQEFQKVVAEELPVPFVFQNSYHAEYIYCFSKIRNSKTAAIEHPETPSYNQGIYIDIFPYDAVPDGDDPDQLLLYAVEQELWMMIVRPEKLLADCASGAYAPRIPLHQLQEIAQMPVQRRFAILENTAASKWGTTKMVNNLVNDMFYKKGRTPVALFQDTIQLKFESIEVPVVRDFDTALQSKYGDWHVFERGTSAHEGVRMSADIPYTEYLREVDL